MKIYRCKELLQLPVMGRDGRPRHGEAFMVAVGAVLIAADEPGNPARMEFLWGGQPICVSLQTLEKHFEELA